MKTSLLIIFAIGMIGLLVATNPQYVDGLCMENQDWPDAPCYGKRCGDSDAPTCTDPNWWKEKWSPYYDYKGKEWMEMKKIELLDAIESNNFEEWRRLTPDDSNGNAFNYYFYMGEIPNTDGMFVDQIFTQSLLPHDTYSESEFVVQNVKFMQNVFYPNELGFYEVEITDRNENPVEMFVTGRVDYEAPWGPSNFSPVGNYDKENQRFVGELTVPGEIIPGNYTLKLNVHGSGKSFPFSGISEVDFVIGERPGSLDTLFEPSSLGSLMGESRYYSIGESRIIDVQLVQGHFYSPPLPNHPASILVYGTDWENFDPNLLEVYEVTSDSNGFIHKELFLDDRNQCDYDVKITSEYNGLKDGHEFDFEITNTEVFYFMWDDEKIPVTVEGKCSIPLSMSFDQPNKTMTVELDTSDAKKQFRIHFPHELLDGDLTVLINGDVNYENFSVDKRHNESIVGVHAISDHTKVEIIGTSAIPEFQTIAMMILAASIIPIILTRNKLILR